MLGSAGRGVCTGSGQPSTAIEPPMGKRPASVHTACARPDNGAVKLPAPLALLAGGRQVALCT